MRFLPICQGSAAATGYSGSCRSWAPSSDSLKVIVLSITGSSVVITQPSTRLPRDGDGLWLGVDNFFATVLSVSSLVDTEENVRPGYSLFFAVHQ